MHKDKDRKSQIFLIIGIILSIPSLFGAIFIGNHKSDIIKAVLIKKKYNLEILSSPPGKEYAVSPSNEISKVFDYFSKTLPSYILNEEDELQKILEIASWLRGELNTDTGQEFQGNEYDVIKAYESSKFSRKRLWCAPTSYIFGIVVQSLGFRDRQCHMEGGDGFGGHSHVANEIWIPSLRKWIFVDVYKNCYFTYVDDSIPLSLVEFRDILFSRPDSIKVHMISSPREHQSESALKVYYAYILSSVVISNKNSWVFSHKLLRKGFPKAFILYPDYGGLNDIITFLRILAAVTFSSLIGTLVSLIFYLKETLTD